MTWLHANITNASIMRWNLLSHAAAIQAAYAQEPGDCTAIFHEDLPCIFTEGEKTHSSRDAHFLLSGGYQKLKPKQAEMLHWAFKPIQRGQSFTYTAYKMPLSHQ